MTMTNINIDIPNEIKSAIQAFAKEGIQSFFVGGCVRDAFLGIQSDDIDICLQGVKTPNIVTQILDEHCDKVANDVGENFPVWIATVNGEKFDFAVTRKEKKAGQSRNEFFIDIDNITIEEDLFRRDLTINAIAINALTGEIVDPFNGVNDLKNRIAREVSQFFAEDSLRVLRAARFISRFSLTPTTSLIDLCKTLEPTDMPNERIGTELTKMFKQAQKPSLFFRFLREVNWLGFHFQAIQDLIGLQQDAEHHPEGDVFEHTMHCMDATNDPFIRCVMLFHDTGKATTTKIENGKITAFGHEKAGVSITKNTLQKIKFADNKTINKIAFLVEKHMIHTNPPTTKKGVGRLLRKLENNNVTFEQLIEVCRCDVSGRPPKKCFTPNIGQDLAKEIQKNNLLKPIVSGNMLIEMGLKPSRELGEMKELLFNLQLEGKLNKENWKDFL